MRKVSKKKHELISLVLDLQNASNAKVIPNLAQFKLWVTTTLAIAGGVKGKCSITIRVVTPKESKKLNYTFRNKNYPTNVLSFSFYSILKLEPEPLGDLAICASLVKKEAKLQSISVNSHWAHLVVHGTLHILGYDHNNTKNAKTMEDLEIKILMHLGFESPY